MTETMHQNDGGGSFVACFPIKNLMIVNLYCAIKVFVANSALFPGSLVVKGNPMPANLNPALPNTKKATQKFEHTITPSHLR